MKNLYFLSVSNMDKKYLYPRIPKNFMTDNGYEDNHTKRVCFSTSIDGCLRALSKKPDPILYVHQPDGEYEIYKPSKDEVPDVFITNEVWITESVKLKCIGSIRIVGDKGDSGFKYTYGNNHTAELYDWEWEWINRIHEINLQ